MMNLAMNTGMNQMKEQAQSLIPSEMQDKTEGQSGDNNLNSLKEPNIETTNKGKPILQKKKKKVTIDRGLSVRMYSILLFHTLIITILLMVIHIKNYDPFKEEEAEKYSKYSWYIFGGCIALSIILSLLVSKVKCISTIYLNYIFYLILLVLNAFAFVWGGKDNLYDFIVSMLIMFDAGSLTVLLFSLFVKDIPSTFWIMCSCVAGHLVAMFVLIRVFSKHKYFVLLTCILSFAIYEAMNYNALDSYKNNSKNKNSIPSMMSLPFELNLSFLKIIYYLLYGIFYWFRACCCSSFSSKKK